MKERDRDLPAHARQPLAGTIGDEWLMFVLIVGRQIDLADLTRFEVPESFG